MNAVLPGSSLPGGLHTRRCVRHSAREAAARCPACGAFFCRECVVEHEGKLLCASCLAKLVTKGGERRQRWALVRRVGISVLGLLVLWACFQGVGALLLKVPASFHNGTIWKAIRDRAQS